MMAPFDTALLKHQPDHLRLATEAERAAAGMAAPKRSGFLAFLAQVFAHMPRHGRAVAPTSLADTRF